MNLLRKQYYTIFYKLFSNKTAKAKLLEIAYEEKEAREAKERLQIEESLTEEQREEIRKEKKKQEERLIIEKSLSFIERLRVLSLKAKYTKYQKQFEDVFEQTKNIHHFVVQNLDKNKFTINKLSQYHLYHTEEFLTLFEDAFSNVSTSANIDSIVIPEKDKNFLSNSYATNIKTLREALAEKNPSWVLVIEDDTTINESSKYVSYIFSRFSIGYDAKDYLYIGTILVGTNLIFCRIDNPSTILKINKFTGKVSHVK